MMVASRRTARKQQFRQSYPDSQPEALWLQFGPDRIKRLKPRKQPLVYGAGMSTSKRLIKVMMSID